MVEYRYLLCDLLTDQLLADLPLSGVSFDRRIGVVGSFTGHLDAVNRLTAGLGRTLKAYAGRSALYVLRDGRPWWGGIPWTVQTKGSERGGVGLDVTAATFDSYPDHRVLRSDVNYTQTDQAAIVCDLWRRLQADSRGNIGVAVEDQTTGTLRDRTYIGADLATYGKLITDLGDVIGGPEVTIDLTLDPITGTRAKRLRVANRLGATTPAFVFQLAAGGIGGTVLEWNDTSDAVDGGTTFQVRGDSADGNVAAAAGPLLSAVRERTDLLAAGWPLLDVIGDRTDVTQLATLESYSAALARDFGGAISTYGYTVQVAGTGWNPNRLGDSVRVKMRDLWHTDSTDMVVRPVACKVTAAERGRAERVELIFGEDS